MEQRLLKDSLVAMQQAAVILDRVPLWDCIPMEVDNGNARNFLIGTEGLYDLAHLIEIWSLFYVCFYGQRTGT